jgi:hypothetical protein
MSRAGRIGIVGSIAIAATVWVRDTPDVRPASYVYGVDNTGNVPLSLAVTPPIDDECASLTLVNGDDYNNQLLDPDEVWEYRCDIALNRVADSNVPPVTGNESGLVENAFTVFGVPFFQGQLEPDKQVSRTAAERTQVIEPGIALTKTLPPTQCSPAAT